MTFTSPQYPIYISNTGINILLANFCYIDKMSILLHKANFLLM